MVALLFHIRCLLLLIVLIQSVSLYKLHESDDSQPDLSSSSFSEELNPSVEDDNIEYADEEGIAYNTINKDNVGQWKLKSKRSASMRPLPQRRNNRPHWNPLVAAYKRCGEFVSREERESCFKDAVQMLFLHKLRK